jgi:hypothetical protein
MDKIVIDNWYYAMWWLVNWQEGELYFGAGWPA